MKNLHWGILGTGNIAGQFAEGLQGSKRGILEAVASRSAEAASVFAKTWETSQAYSPYETLLDDPKIDAVYIALPNALHKTWTLRALEAGKHVLCEKPLANDFAQARQMFAAAKKYDRLLVEAFMYRSHPMYQVINDQIAQGVIGELRSIRTSFCFNVRKTENNIRFSRSLAGGALMDIGCYCVNFSRWLAQAEPIASHAMGQLHASGIDKLTAGTLQFESGLLAEFTCGMCLHADNTAMICGQEGYIEIPVPWKPPRQRACFTVAHGIPPRMDGAGVRQMGPDRQTWHVNADRPLYGLEADDFAAAVLDAQPVRVSETDTLGNMRVLDTLRSQIGVVFEDLK